MPLKTHLIHSHLFQLLKFYEKNLKWRSADSD